MSESDYDNFFDALEKLFVVSPTTTLKEKIKALRQAATERECRCYLEALGELLALPDRNR